MRPASGEPTTVRTPASTTRPARKSRPKTVAAALHSRVTTVRIIPGHDDSRNSAQLRGKVTGESPQILSALERSEAIGERLCEAV
jgi:hypothetical protein